MKRNTSSEVVRRGLAVCLLVAVGVAGCSNPAAPNGNGGGDYVSGIIVAGNVLDNQGVEVFGTTVRATAYVYDLANVCTQAVGNVVEGSVNEQGDYVLQLNFDRRRFQACLIVEAIPPDGSGFLSKTENRLDVDVNEKEEGLITVIIQFVLDRG